MDWALVALTAAVSWCAFLVASDLGALLRVPARLASRAHSVTFFASLSAIVALGYVVAERPHGTPCTSKGTPSR